MFLKFRDLPHSVSQKEFHKNLFNYARIFHKSPIFRRIWPESDKITREKNSFLHFGWKKKLLSIENFRAWNRIGTEPRTQVLAKNRTRTGTQESRTRTEPEPKKLKRTEPKRTRVLLGSSKLIFFLNFHWFLNKKF